MNLKESKRGSGVWKMNISILQDIAYIDNIRELISEVKESNHFLSKQMLWEILKIEIKEYTIGYCIKKQSVKKNIIKEVEAQIQQKENELISSNYTHQVQLEKDMLVSRLQNLVEDQNGGGGHKLEAGQNGWKRAKNVHNTSLT